MLKVARECNMHYESRQQALGAVTLLLASDPTWVGDLKKYMVDELIPAHRHGKLAFFVGADDQPVGFIVWANLSEETERRIMETDDPWLHGSEWNEGPSLWIRYVFLQKRLWAQGFPAWKELICDDQSPLRTMIMRKNQIQILEIEQRVAQRFAARCRLKY